MIFLLSDDGTYVLVIVFFVCFFPEYWLAEKSITEMTYFVLIVM